MGQLWVNLFESSRALDEMMSETSDDPDTPLTQLVAQIPRGILPIGPRVAEEEVAPLRVRHRLFLSFAGDWFNRAPLGRRV